MIHSVVFSPSGTTSKIANKFVESLNGDLKLYDVTVTGTGQVTIEDEGDIAVFSVPVYAGRVPDLAAERIQKIKGNGQKAVAIVVYGNRDYDDALVELCDIVSDCGFKIIAAGAFVAEHCIFPKVAAGRPDSSDLSKITEFAGQVKKNIEDDTFVDLHSIKGNHPYKKAGKVPLHPDVKKDKCNECGTCAEQCPTEAIDNANPRATDTSKCITCCRCINVCPQEARYLGGTLYKLAGWKFVKDNSRRLEPEWFV